MYTTVGNSDNSITIILSTIIMPIGLSLCLIYHLKPDKKYIPYRRKLTIDTHAVSLVAGFISSSPHAASHTPLVGGCLGCCGD